MEESKNEIVTYQTANGTEVQLSPSIVNQLTNNNTNITNDEVQLFIALCQNLKLNPLIKEAYLVKYDKTKPAQQIISLGAFMRIAEDNKNYDGMEDGIIVQTADGKLVERVGTICLANEKLIGGWAKVYRKDRTRPTVVKINLKEYAKGQATWNSMPSTMINKCAKVGALRAAFPNSFNNCYGDSEIQDYTNNPQTENIENTEIDISTKADTKIQSDDIKPEVVNEDEIVIEDLQDIPDEPIPPTEKDEPLFTEEEVNEIMEKEMAELKAKEQPQKIEVTYREYYNNKDKYTLVPNSYKETAQPDGYVRKTVKVTKKVAE